MKARWLIAGLLAGLMLAGSPVDAGDKKVDRLTRRINNLSTRLSQVEAGIPIVNQRIVVLETWRADTGDVAGRLGILEQRTQSLGLTGQYFGFVEGNRLLIPSGCDGDPAVWDTGTGNGLDC